METKTVDEIINKAVGDTEGCAAAESSSQRFDNMLSQPIDSHALADSLLCNYGFAIGREMSAVYASVSTATKPLKSRAYRLPSNMPVI